MNVQTSATPVLRMVRCAEVARYISASATLNLSSELLTSSHWQKSEETWAWDNSLSTCVEFCHIFYHKLSKFPHIYMTLLWTIRHFVILRPAVDLGRPLSSIVHTMVLCIHFSSRASHFSSGSYVIATTVLPLLFGLIF